MTYPDDNSHYYNKVAVFDSHSVNTILNDETQISFGPIEFSFFDKLSQYYDLIKKKYYADKKEVENKNEIFHDRFKATFSSKSDIGKVVNELNKNKNIDDIINVSRITEEDNNKNDAAIKRKGEIISLDIEKKSLEYQEHINNIKKLLKTTKLISNYISTDKINELNQEIETYHSLDKITKSEGISQFTDYDIYNLGSDEWVKFISAAKDYFESIEAENIDTCLFCGQNTSKVEVIDKYWIYLQSDSKSKMNEISKKISEKEDNYKMISSIFEQHSIVINYISNTNQHLHKVLNDYIAIIKNECMKIIKKIDNLNSETQILIPKFDLKLLNNEIKFYEEKINALNHDEFENEIKKLNIQILNHNDKLKVPSMLDSINIYINNIIWLDIKPIFSTSFITNFQNRLFSKYVNNNYIETFIKECENLGMDLEVNINSRGKKGATLNKLVINNVQAGHVLSEGEQKAVALANFITETELLNDNFCLIFDDPVSSLDLEWREKISKRLVEVAKTKQVVIFSHDLPFIKQIEEYTSKEKVQCTNQVISRYGLHSGIISHENTPWISSTVKERTSMLNREKQELSSLYNKMTNSKEENEYKMRADNWFEKLREAWERSIEEVVFNGAILRFGRSVQTQKLRKVNFTTEDYEKIESGMGNVTKWVHDNSINLGEIIAKPDDMDESLEHFTSFVKEYRK